MKSFIAVVLVLVLSILAISPLDAAPQDYDTNDNNVIDRDELLSAIRDHLFTDKLTLDELYVLIRLHLFKEPVVTEPRPELSGLILTHGAPAEVVPLSPAFIGASYSYTASVGYEVVQLTVTAMGSDDATIMIVRDDGITAQPDADSGTEGHQVTLMPGENVIRVKVAEGDSSQIYAITVTRSIPKVNVSVETVMADEGAVLSFSLERIPVAADALEVMIDVSETGDFVGPGNEGIKTVTIAANSSTSIYTVPTDSDDDAWDPHSVVTVTLQTGDPYVVGDASSAQTQVKDNDFPQATAALTVNPNPVAEGEPVTVSVTVTTDLDQEPHADGGFIEVSTLDDTAASPQDYVFLQESFIVDAAHFSAATVSGNNKYQATYTSTVSTVDDAMRESGETFTVQFSKTNADMITLASPSSVSVAISESTDATLSALGLSGATLSPIFASTTEIYTADVGNSVSSTTVTAIPNDAGAIAVIKIGGTEDPDGTVDLMEGANVITVVITAEDGVTTKTYTVAVARSSTPDTGNVLTVSELVTKVRASVVRISRSDGGSGSGVIFETLDQTAFIATNQHVVRLEEVVTVIVNDSTSYDGTVLGIDSVRDLAVVSICCGDFTASAFGDDDNLEIGTDIVAIGYALGLAGSATVTKGIVSRVFDDVQNMRKLIQTDAALNPGNSGGPVFTLDGLVVAVHVAGIDQTSTGRPVEGVSFSISANTVKEQIPALRSGVSTLPPTLPPTPTPGEGYDFGPTSGELRHDPTDNFIKTEYADISLGDMMVEATFVNPYSASSNSWDYGFVIRYDRNAPFLQVLISSGSHWEVKSGSGAPYQRIASGTLSDLDLSAGGQNHLRVVAIGDLGWLFVNGDFVSSFDLGNVTGPGLVAVVTGAYTGDEVAGAVTRFENFKGYELTKRYGPAEGTLKQEPGQLATHYSGVGSGNLVAEAEFVNPQGRDWLYGFTIFDINGIEGIGLTSNGQWFQDTYDTRDEDYTVVGSGPLSNWKSGASSRNHLVLITFEEEGWLFVNGELEVELELSHTQGRDEIAITGLFLSDTGSLEFEKFNVWAP